MNKDYPDPPAAIEELDRLFAHIDLGNGDLVSLSDEQREALKEEISAAWLTKWLPGFPVPGALKEAAAQYRAIAAGDLYPHLTERVRSDLLLRFDEAHGEGGPVHWSEVERDDDLPAAGGPDPRLRPASGKP